MAARTKVLGQGVQASGTSVHTVYTAPTGKVAIVKSLSFISDSAINVDVRVVRSGNDVGAAYPALVAGQGQTVQTYLSLEAGDSLTVAASSSHVLKWWASGFEIDA